MSSDYFRAWLGSGICTYEAFDENKPEDGELILYADPAPGDKYQTEEIRTVMVNASEVDELFVPLTVRFKFVINLTVK